MQYALWLWYCIVIITGYSYKVNIDKALIGIRWIMQINCYLSCAL